MTIAKGELHGRPIEAEVLNFGNWFGKTWLVELGGSYTPLFLAIEADSMSDAIDELSDSKYGHQIHVAEEDLGDYPEDSRHYDGQGRVIDLDHVMVYGKENCERPWPCLIYKDEPFVNLTGTDIKVGNRIIVAQNTLPVNMERSFTTEEDGVEIVHEYCDDEVPDPREGIYFIVPRELSLQYPQRGDLIYPREPKLLTDSNIIECRSLGKAV